MKIGVTDTMVSEDKFRFYVDWLLGGDPNAEIIKLSYKIDNLNELEKCDGLLITGGNDVDPSLYNGPSEHRLIKDVDRRRDDFERKLTDKAVAMNMPLLAVCRGMQLVNVHFGGTLLPDIEESGYKSHKTSGTVENYHSVTVSEPSFLRSICGVAKGMVNSRHHQAVGTSGEGLKITARADDGIIEAMELEGYAPFGLLVQWHPERMNDSENPLAANIRNRFLLTISYS
jgi:putative glutamine amidotransferase